MGSGNCREASVEEQGSGMVNVMHQGILQLAREEMPSSCATTSKCVNNPHGSSTSFDKIIDDSFLLIPHILSIRHTLEDETGKEVCILLSCLSSLW